MKHQLQLLSPGAFQSMAAALAIAEFGPGVQVMGVGKDGGRDLYFEGTLNFGSADDSSAETFTDYTVFQVKHHDKISDSETTNASWLWGEVKNELDAWAEWDKSDPPDPLPDQLVFITNVGLTPVQKHRRPRRHPQEHQGLPRQAKRPQPRHRRSRRNSRQGPAARADRAHQDDPILGRQPARRSVEHPRRCAPTTRSAYGPREPCWTTSRGRPRRRTCRGSLTTAADACTNADRIPRWFLPVEGDLVVGGRYQLSGNAGGVVESCDAPRELKATWEFAGDVSWIRVTFTEEQDGARFTLEHVASTENEHWDTYGPAAVGMGWDGMLHGLHLHVESGEPIDAELAAAWMVSDEAKRFNATSGELWLTADIAAGTPEADAQQRIDATVKAFSGEE